ncbi:ATP-binding protein [uncultured Paludibaculum sp.]|uniref:sensor histidine kinase n=1 Tax=uncultured Paludibaculum sp. TaxID=1765020 RepID=UPI002AAC4D14|nr:ATP-binding protein [uncultured Paludibaculum sp.]
MRQSISRPVRLIWILTAFGLPAMLFYSAIRTYKELDDQKTVYLRSRVAAIAARLETLPPGLSSDEILETFSEEPGLMNLRVLEPPAQAESDPLADLWRGRELFRTENEVVAGRQVFRAFVPFHTGNGLRLARIELAENTADFLVEHARHHLWFAGFGGILILALSLFALWSLERTAEAERRQLELQHLAHIGKMSAVLAHEIRNPLGTIKGFAQLLDEQLPSGYSEYLQPILSETARLEGLVKDLLLYGRPAQAVLRQVESTELAETVQTHIHQALASGAVRLEKSIVSVTFESDPNLLEQALLNLLRNSMEALQERGTGTVRLEVESRDGQVVWRVLDDGPGLSEEARRRLYEPFYTSKAFGTGLGLSITRKLVEALGGQFRIENRAEAGTMATIVLPSRPGE